LEQEINLHIKIIVKPNETDYEMPYVVVQNWRLKRAAKGANTENQKNF
jgi:hypothetical protein